MLLVSYQNEDDMNMSELIKNLAKEHMIWSRQAFEILYMFKNVEQFAEVAPFLLSRVVDRHNRFMILNHFSNNSYKLLTQIKQKMGDAFFFSFWNPSRHYDLNLANPIEREIAMTLLVLNKDAIIKMQQNLVADKSQNGNKSCFRNEKLNGMSFVMDSQNWALPQQGLFEFDFNYLINRPLSLGEDDQESIS